MLNNLLKWLAGHIRPCTSVTVPTGTVTLPINPSQQGTYLLWSGQYGSWSQNGLWIIFRGRWQGGSAAHQIVRQGADTPTVSVVQEGTGGVDFYKVNVTNTKAATVWVKWIRLEGGGKHNPAVKLHYQEVVPC